MSGTDPRAQAEPSSAERAGTFHRSMEAWNARDMDAMFAVLTDDVGDSLVERGPWSATGHTSGIHGTIEFSSVIAFDGPLVARMDVFLDYDNALAFASDPG